MAGDRRPRAVPLAVESRSSNCVEIDLVEMVYRSDTEGVPDSERAPAVASFGDCCLLMSALIAACNCVLSPRLNEMPACLITVDNSSCSALNAYAGQRVAGIPVAGLPSVAQPGVPVAGALSAWAASPCRAQ